MNHVVMGAGGEFDLIRTLAARWGGAAAGLGDDAAVLDVPAGHRLVVSTDASVEGVHFRRDWLTPGEIGWRAMASALSDLAAMGAAPLGVLLALTLPDAWRADLAALADGMGACVAASGTQIVGGDTTRGDALALAITVLGTAERPLRREGAQVGDAVYVSGALGGPHRAWQALAAGVRPTDADRIRFARPVPRLSLGAWLAAHGATAAIDVSDGLAQDLGHVASASGVHLRLDAAAVPCLPGATPAEALAGGEEYELAFTAPAGLDVVAAAAAGGVAVTRIGAVVAGPAGVTVGDAGRVVEVPRGYDHFSPS